MEGTTKSGFNFKVDERVLKDWRFTMALSKMENRGEPMEVLRGMDEMASLLLGDQMKAFIEHIKAKNGGFAPTEAVIAELKEILEAFPKN